MSIAIRQQIAMLTAQANEKIAMITAQTNEQIAILDSQATRIEAEEKAKATAEAAVRAASEAEEKVKAARAAARAATEAEKVAEAARQAEAAKAEERTVRLRLDSGKSIAFSSKDNTTVLCPFDKGQKFKIHRITSGRQAGNVVFEAVGGEFGGMVLDNCTGSSTKLIFYGRTSDRNNCQHWKYTDGKISSVKGGRQIKVGQNGKITFAKEGEEGDTFTEE